MAAHRINHFREKFVSQKMFAIIHLRKKSSQISGIPDPESESGLYIFRILKKVTLFRYGSFVVKYVFEIYHSIDF